MTSSLFGGGFGGLTVPVTGWWPELAVNQAQGTYGWSSAATGRRAPKGTASGTYGWAGTAQGASTTNRSGSAGGTYTWASSAVGARSRGGTAAGTYTWAASAAVGDAPPDHGSAGGTYTWSSSAAGARTPKATASGTYTWAGTAAGTAPLTGPQFIGANDPLTVGSLPAHQAGDIIIVWGFRDGNITPPTAPAGWTNINNTGANSCSERAVYKVAASSSEVLGTWSNVSQLIAHVYRNVSAIGVSATGTGSSGTVSWPALTLQVTNGTSWVAAFGGHVNFNGNMGVVPTGLTNRVNIAGTTSDAASFDTNGGVASWTAKTTATGETAGGYATTTIELKA